MGWFYKHRYLWGYVGIVAVSVLGAYLYQHHTISELNRRDAQSCAQRNKLAQNQRSVLGGVIAVLAIEANEAEKHHQPGTTASLLAILKDLRERQPQAGPENC